MTAEIEERVHCGSGAMRAAREQAGVARNFELQAVLEHELKTLRPRVVLALGKIAWTPIWKF